MERDNPEKGSLEIDFRGGQGPPRAVAPRRTQNNLVPLIEWNIVNNSYISGTKFTKLLPNFLHVFRTAYVWHNSIAFLNAPRSWSQIIITHIRISWQSWLHRKKWCYRTWNSSMGHISFEYDFSDTDINPRVASFEARSFCKQRKIPRCQEPKNIYWHLPSSERWTLKRQHKTHPLQSTD
jgi:hypothetical protein